MSTRTKILGALAILMCLLFIAFESESGQRYLRDSFEVPLDPDDLLHGSAMMPALLFLAPGLVLGIAAAWSKIADGRRHRR